MTDSGDSAALAQELTAWTTDARRRTLELLEGLHDSQLMGPRLATVNPLRWELGHVGWFQEIWTLRRARGEPPILAGGDALYDSAKVAHDTRWDLPLPSFTQTLAYVGEVERRVLARLGAGGLTAEQAYFHRFATFHEDMHGEAFVYTRQTLGYPSPWEPRAAEAEAGPLDGDVEVPGGTLSLGASEEDTFVFDNEKWAHPVTVAPFRIARAPVTNADYARWVDAGGAPPRDWRQGPRGWERRVFDRWVPLEPHHPVTFVSWNEAEAYCRWAGRRLPTEAEWEMAAKTEPGWARERRYPWGDAPPGPERANLDASLRGCLDVAALPAGDSAWGCRQMIGNVWEWTSSDFLPYPGFTVDPYREYSEPWFGTHKVLRGGSWVTRSRMIRNTWRNFYTPDRRDVLAGFRTCAVG